MNSNVIIVNSETNVNIGKTKSNDLFDIEKKTIHNHNIILNCFLLGRSTLGTNEDIVDRDMNQLHKIANKTHYNTANSSGSSIPLKP